MIKKMQINIDINTECDSPNKVKELIFSSRLLSVGEKRNIMNEKMREFEEACKPMIEYLRKYYNPMCKAIISDGFSEVVVSDIGVPNDVQD